MPVDSLQSIAQRAAGRYVHGISSVGDLPWTLVGPIIAKIKSPEQLYTVEQNSPQIIGHDEECWIAFMKQDIPRFSQDKPHRPSDPKNWFKVYKKLKRAADAETAASAEKLKAAFASIKEEKEQNLAKLTTKVVMPARRINTGWAARGHWTPSTKTLTASERIKRQVNDSAKARMLRERNQIKLSGQLKQSAYKNPTKVAVAPRAMVEEIKARNASPPPPAVRAPIRRSHGSDPLMLPPNKGERRRPHEAGEGYDLMQDREARLKALQTKKPEPTDFATSRTVAAGPGGLSHDFLEDDDLFSEEEAGQQQQDGDGDGDDDTMGPPLSRITPPKPSAMASPAIRPARPLSPLPKTAVGVKRKAPPTLFMSSPGKKVRPKVT